MRIRIFHSIGLAVLAVWGLAVTAFASDKSPLARSVKVKADVVFVISLDPATLGEAVGTGEGQGSSLGKFVVHSAGSFDFETSEFIAEGVLTTAHGDLIYFKMRNLDGVEFTGGTGGFANATGGHTIEPTAPLDQRIIDGQLIVTFSYTGQGTITYQRSAGYPSRPGSSGSRPGHRTSAAGFRHFQQPKVVESPPVSAWRISPVWSPA